MLMVEKYDNLVVDLAYKYDIPSYYSHKIVCKYAKSLDGLIYELDLSDSNIQKKIENAPKIEYKEATYDRVYKICKIYYEELRKLKNLIIKSYRLEDVGDYIDICGKTDVLMRTKKRYGIKYGIYESIDDKVKGYKILFENGVSPITYYMINEIRDSYKNGSVILYTFKYRGYQKYTNFDEIYKILLKSFHKNKIIGSENFLYPTAEDYMY